MSFPYVDKKGRRHSVNPLDVLFKGGKTLLHQPLTLKPNGNEQPAKGATATDASPTELPLVGVLTEPVEGKKGGASSKADAEKEAEAQPSNTGGQNDNMFTEEEDRELLELQGAGKSWKEIGSKLGKSKKAVTTRFGQLKAAEKRNKYPASGAPKSKSETTKHVQFAESIVEPKNGGKEDTMVIEPEAAGANFMASTTASDHNVRATLAKYAEHLVKRNENSETAVYNDIKSLALDETRLIARLEAYYEEQKWMAIVSQIHNLSGKRVDPSALKAEWGAEFQETQSGHGRLRQ